MDMVRDKTLELMVKTESTKWAKRSYFEHSSLLHSSKSHNLII